MTAEQLDDLLCRLKRQKPFRPFVVVLHDGRRIPINSPALAINRGATFITPDWELVEFNYDEVREVRELVDGAAL